MLCMCEHLLRTTHAESAFKKLKDCFTTAPLLTIPDPLNQFVVKVDASDIGTGAVLSQGGI